MKSFEQHLRADVSCAFSEPGCYAIRTSVTVTQLWTISLNSRKFHITEGFPLVDSSSRIIVETKTKLSGAAPELKKHKC